MATHPIKLWSVRHISEEWLTPVERFEMLRAGMRDLRRRGRLVLSAKMYQEVDLRYDGYRTHWGFRSIYVGRRAILRRGFRHRVRAGLVN